MTSNRVENDWQRVGSLPKENLLVSDPEDEPLLSRWNRKTEQCIGDHPVAALAVAVALGLTLGWLVKRR